MRAALTLSARHGVRSRASLAAGGGCFRPHEHDGAMGRKKNPHTHTPAVAIAAKAERGLCGAGLAKEFVFGGSGFGSVTDSRDRQERGLKYGHPQSITFFQESLRKKFFQSS